MKESNFLVGNAVIKQNQKKILLNTKLQHMKESNMLVGNATISNIKGAPCSTQKGSRVKCLSAIYISLTISVLTYLTKK